KFHQENQLLIPHPQPLSYPRAAIASGAYAIASTTACGGASERGATYRLFSVTFAIMAITKFLPFRGG
ncbi:MAG: hypothetical protein ACP5E3_13130, partial [Bacteroidales bacterium]